MALVELARTIRIVMLLVLSTGCNVNHQVEILLSGENAENILQFYFGSYMQEDPFNAGVLEKKRDRFFLDLSLLREFDSELSTALEARVSRNTLDPDSLQTVIEATYYEARNLPGNLTEFESRWPIHAPKTFEVHGAVTHYLRRIALSEKALQDAIFNYDQNNSKLYYEVGTVLKAEHISNDSVKETTAMIKRPDGFWDFATYDSAGTLTLKTRPHPRALATPTQCVGCHFGNKSFEPERSWPLDAPPVPEGIRKWYTGSADQEVADYFREHDRRSDFVLGLYATTYISDLRVQRSSSTLDSTSIRLLNELGL